MFVFPLDEQLLTVVQFRSTFQPIEANNDLVDGTTGIKQRQEPNGCSFKQVRNENMKDL